MRLATALGSLAAATLLTFAACSSGGGGTTASPGATSTTSAGNPAATGTKADANKASVEQLTAALNAAGVSNAGRWAREVDEYRPYPTDDPTFAKLRQNLAKYNPGDDVVEKIVSTLSL
jgi:hypothetical protein